MHTGGVELNTAANAYAQDHAPQAGSDFDVAIASERQAGPRREVARPGGVS
jgi:hypothetical protein